MNNVANKHQTIIKVLAYCIENDEQGVKNLLKRNGIEADLVKSKRELTRVFLDALSKSKTLALDFNKYIKLKMAASKTSNAGGREPLVALNIDDLAQGGTYGQLPTVDLPETLPSKPTFSTDSFNNNLNNSMQNTGFFSGLNLKDLLNTGVQALELQKDIQVSKDNRQAVEQAVQVKRDEMNLKPETTKNSTGIYIGLGIVGLVLIGGMIYFATKKK
jgi:hypothetical protein